MRRALLMLAACIACGVIGRLTAPLPAVADTPVGNGDVNGDGKLDLADAVYIINNQFYAGPAPLPIDCPPAGGPALPATGQTKCYGETAERGWVEVPCEGAEIPGQDGACQAGCPAEGRYVDHGDGTVTDSCTGLMWQEGTADVDGDGAATFRDQLRWRWALAYCESLTLAGHDDWRLPNVRELESIVDYGRLNPTLDPAFDALTPPNYWSSTTVGDFPGSAWFVDFAAGGIYVNSKAFDSFVRAVRDAS